MLTLKRYAELTNEIRALVGEQAEVQTAEARAQLAVYAHDSTSTSVSALDRAARVASADYTLELFDLRAKVAAAEAELRFLDRLLAAQLYEWRD